MGRLSQQRQTRINLLLRFAQDLMQRDVLTEEQVRESVRRYILVHYSASPYTVQGYVEEVLAKLQYQVEKDEIARLA